MTDITTFLTWVIGFGAPAAAAIVLSLLAENWPAWSTFPHIVKFIVPLLVSVGLSVLSAVLLQYPALLAQLAPWFQIVASAVIAYWQSQKTYQGSLEARYGKRFTRADSKSVKQLPLG